MFRRGASKWAKMSMRSRAGNGWPWSAMSGNGRPGLAMAGRGQPCRPWLAMALLVVAMSYSSWPKLHDCALDGISHKYLIYILSYV